MYRWFQAYKLITVHRDWIDKSTLTNNTKGTHISIDNASAYQLDRSQVNYEKVHLDFFGHAMSCGFMSKEKVTHWMQEVLQDERMVLIITFESSFRCPLTFLYAPPLATCITTLIFYEKSIKL